jgi:hypothetical protein
MELLIEWERSLRLRDATEQNMIHSVDWHRLPSDAGIYIFGRRWGRNFEALYVGKANNIASRVRGQLNNLRLMQHVKNARTGKRLLIAGAIDPKPGQRTDKCLKLIERGLIRYFLSEGHDLVNKQGTRLRRHEIISSGRLPRSVVPREVFLERGKGE